MIILSLLTMITLKGVWFSSYMFIHVNKCYNPFFTTMHLNDCLFGWTQLCFFTSFILRRFPHLRYGNLYYTSSVSLHEISVLHFIWFSERRPCFYFSPIFHAKHIMSTGTLTLFVFCLYPCFVSVVQIFPHKSQREGLSVHVNFCVGSLLYSRFMITIVTFYCRIGKLLCQLISVLSFIAPIKHIITDLTPGCLVCSVVGHTQNL